MKVTIIDNTKVIHDLMEKIKRYKYVIIKLNKEVDDLKKELEKCKRM